MKEPLASAKFLKWFAIGLLLICLSIITLTVISISQSRLQYEKQAATTTINLVQVLDEYITGVITKTDVALLSVADEAQRQLSSGGINRQALSTYIVRQCSRIQELDGLRMTNAKGDAAYGMDLASGANIADLDYFIHSRNESKSGILISEPVVGRISGKWIINIARRVNYPDGSFAGVVQGTIALENFAKRFARINVGKNGDITLFGSEFIVICRYPDPPGAGSAIGKKYASPTLQEIFKRGQTSATYRARSAIDGIERMYSYRKISDLPLYEFVGLARDDYLAEWRTNNAKMLALMALRLLVVSSLAWVLWRHIIGLKQTEEALCKSNEELEKRVSDRTLELTEINEQLHGELAERKRMEEQIKQSLKEKETLLREIHHRVKNNMAVVSSLLALQAKNVKEPTVRQYLEESQQRIKSMALVHEKLYQTRDFSSINFKEYIKSLVQEITALSRIDSNTISQVFNIEDIELTLESAIPCGLIINELLTNAFKYAFPDNRSGVISVNFTKIDDTCTLAIKDNGVGLPEGFDYKNARTLGLQLVNVLARQLMGTLQIKADNKGTEAIVTFKINKK